MPRNSAWRSGCGVEESSNSSCELTATITVNTASSISSLRHIRKSLPTLYLRDGLLKLSKWLCIESSIRRSVCQLTMEYGEKWSFIISLWYRPNSRACNKFLNRTMNYTPIQYIVWWTFPVQAESLDFGLAGLPFWPSEPHYQLVASEAATLQTVLPLVLHPRT